jgi:hypothetical protein
VAEASGVLGIESIDMIDFISPFCPPSRAVAEHNLVGESKNRKKCKPDGVTKVSVFRTRNF